MTITWWWAALMALYTSGRWTQVSYVLCKSKRGVHVWTCWHVCVYCRRWWKPGGDMYLKCSVCVSGGRCAIRHWFPLLSVTLFIPLALSLNVPQQHLLPLLPIETQMLSHDLSLSLSPSCSIFDGCLCFALSASLPLLTLLKWCWNFNHACLSGWERWGCT